MPVTSPYKISATNINQGIAVALGSSANPDSATALQQFLVVLQPCTVDAWGTSCLYAELVAFETLGMHLICGHYVETADRHDTVH